MRIIVSMTTIPSRINHIEPVLDSLINQTVKPYMIYLNIPKKYNRFESDIKIPDFINNKYAHIVRIFYLENDYGPGTKFIGSLMNPLIFDKDIIVVTDDDVVKKKHWLYTLFQNYKENRITSFVELNLGQKIIWGYLGYIFRKDLIDLKDLLNFYSKIQNECWLVDDHWFTGYCHYKNIDIFNISIERNSEINSELLTGKDALVRLKGSDSRKKVSENCRKSIYKKFNSTFPFWCCIGCCPRKANYTENFTQIQMSTHTINIINGFMLVILLILFYLKKISIVILILAITLIFLFNPRKSEYFINKNISNSLIPKVVIQTYNTKHNIPAKVYSNIKKYAPGYKHIIYNDTECIHFITKYFKNDTINTFKILKGAHKADLFRYCYLYINGGVYLDIKTELIKPIDKIFTKNYTYSVLSIINKSIYQGIIACAPKNPIFLELIDYIIKTASIKKEYLIYTYDFYNKMSKKCSNMLVEGFNRNLQDSNYDFYLFREICSENEDDCYDKLDRRNLCCYIYNLDREKIIKTRYSDYPW